MSDASEMLRQQQEELERIRARRSRHALWMKKETLRKVLNLPFLAFALAGLVLYYFVPEMKDFGFGLIIGGMAVKIVELLIRFLG